jgi:hypothetical protein
MPCPTPTPISGTGKAQVVWLQSRARAEATAMAAVPGAARSSALEQMIASGFCPPDCAFPNPNSITFQITGVYSQAMVFANVFFGWLFWLAGDGFFYSGTAEYTWRAVAACSPQRPSFAVLGVEERS